MSGVAMAGKWLGFVQWEGGFKRAGRAPTFEAALELARNLAAELCHIGHVSCGATRVKLTIDPEAHADISRVLSGRGGSQTATTRVDAQMVRIRARISRWEKARKL